MFVNLSAKKILLYSATFQLILVVFAPIYQVFIGPGSLDSSFLRVYLIFVVLLPLLSLYHFARKVNSKEAVIEYTKEIAIVGGINIENKLEELVKNNKWRLTSHRGNYQMETPLTWASFGEFVQVRVNNFDKKLIISSRPKLSFTKIDYGKNKENVLRVSQYFQKS